MASKPQIRVDVFFTPTHLEEMQLKDKTVVVIDVLRASTTVVTALRNGAKEIIPVKDIESAVKVSSSLYGDVTLRGGERNSKMIEGFNLGNSPLEYREEVVKGKSIIFLTTNGSLAMVKGRHAKNLVVAAFVNLSAVVSFLASLRSDFVVVCAGKESTFCIEDAVCAGRIIGRVAKTISADLIINDAGNAAVALDKALGKSLIKLLKTSEHGRYLTEIGFANDLEVCAALDSIDALPILLGNVLRIQANPTKRPT